MRFYFAGFVATALRRDRMNAGQRRRLRQKLFWAARDLFRKAVFHNAYPYEMFLYLVQLTGLTVTLHGERSESSEEGHRSSQSGIAICD